MQHLYLPNLHITRNVILFVRDLSEPLVVPAAQRVSEIPSPEQFHVVAQRRLLLASASGISICGAEKLLCILLPRMGLVRTTYFAIYISPGV